MGGEGSKSFFQTLPGILSGIAALLGGAAALLGVLYQMGLISTRNPVPTVTMTPAPAMVTPAPTPISTSGPPSGGEAVNLTGVWLWQAGGYCFQIEQKNASLTVVRSVGHGRGPKPQFPGSIAGHDVDIWFN